MTTINRISQCFLKGGEFNMMRATMHNGRMGKHGIFSAFHNDRNYDIDGDDHIDPEQTKDNIKYHYYHDFNDPENPNNQLTFEEVEQKFYEEHLSNHLEMVNKNYIKNYHPERCKTMKEYRKSIVGCPEETIFAIGKKGEQVDQKTLEDVVTDYVIWEMETYPNVTMLNLSLHVDEDGVNHFHQRKVWLGHDDEGHVMVSQTKGLEEMGIERPRPEKKKTRYNNAKVTHTEQCRSKLLEICKDYGVEIIEEPKTPSKKTVDLLEYQVQAKNEELNQMNTKMTELETQIEVKTQKAKEMTKKASESLLEATKIKTDTIQYVKDLEARESLMDTLRFKLQNEEKVLNKQKEAFEKKKIEEKPSDEAEQEMIVKFWKKMKLGENTGLKKYWDDFRREEAEKKRKEALKLKKTEITKIPRQIPLFEYIDEKEENEEEGWIDYE